MFELLTPRLRLRPVAPADAPELTAYRALPDVARFQSWENYTLADAQRLIERQASIVPNTPNTWLQLALILRETGELIGDSGVHFLADGSRTIEIGFTLSPAHQGRGLATEAVASVLRWAFTDLGTHRIFGTTDVRNEPASKLFRRLGFREEGTLVEHAMYKGEWVSESLFAILQKEWKASVETPKPVR